MAQNNYSIKQKERRDNVLGEEATYNGGNPNQLPPPPPTREDVIRMAEAEEDKNKPVTEEFLTWLSAKHHPTVKTWVNRGALDDMTKGEAQRAIVQKGRKEATNRKKARKKKSEEKRERDEMKKKTLALKDAQDRKHLNFQEQSQDEYPFPNFSSELTDEQKKFVFNHLLPPLTNMVIASDFKSKALSLYTMLGSFTPQGMYTWEWIFDLVTQASYSLVQPFAQSADEKEDDPDLKGENFLENILQQMYYFPNFQKMVKSDVGKTIVQLFSYMSLAPLLRKLGLEWCADNYQNMCEKMQETKEVCSPLYGLYTHLTRLFEHFIREGYQFFLDGDIKHLYYRDSMTGWLQRSNRLLAYETRHIVSDIAGEKCGPEQITESDYCQQSAALIEEGDDLTRCHPTDRNRPMVFSNIRTLHSRKLEVIKELASGNVRQEPVCIGAEGPPGIGKESVIIDMHRLFAQVIEVPYTKKLVFTQGNDDKFYSGYKPSQHVILHYDDLGAVKAQRAEDDPTTAGWINLIGTTEKKLPQPIAEHKGLPMRSKLVTCTSNNLGANLKVTTHHPEAFFRRFDYIIYPRLKEEVRAKYGDQLPTNIKQNPDNDLWWFEVFRFRRNSQAGKNETKYFAQLEKIPIKDGKEDTLGPMDIFRLRKLMAKEIHHTYTRKKQRFESMQDEEYTLCIDCGHAQCVCEYDDDAETILDEEEENGLTHEEKKFEEDQKPHYIVGMFNEAISDFSEQMHLSISIQGAARIDFQGNEAISCPERDEEDCALVIPWRKFAEFMKNSVTFPNGIEFDPVCVPKMLRFFQHFKSKFPQFCYAPPELPSAMAQSDDDPSFGERLNSAYHRMLASASLPLSQRDRQPAPRGAVRDANQQFTAAIGERKRRRRFHSNKPKAMDEVPFGWFDIFCGCYENFFANTWADIWRPLIVEGNTYYFMRGVQLRYWRAKLGWAMYREDRDGIVEALNGIRDSKVKQVQEVIIWLGIGALILGAVGLLASKLKSVFKKEPQFEPQGMNISIPSKQPEESGTKNHYQIHHNVGGPKIVEPPKKTLGLPNDRIYDMVPRSMGLLHGINSNYIHCYHITDHWYLTVAHSMKKNFHVDKTYTIQSTFVNSNTHSTLNTTGTHKVRVGHEIFFHSSKDLAIVQLSGPPKTRGMQYFAEEPLRPDTMLRFNNFRYICVEESGDLQVEQTSDVKVVHGRYMGLDEYMIQSRVRNYNGMCGSPLIREGSRGRGPYVVGIHSHGDIAEKQGMATIVTKGDIDEMLSNIPGGVPIAQGSCVPFNEDEIEELSPNSWLNNVYQGYVHVFGTLKGVTPPRQKTRVREGFLSKKASTLGFECEDLVAPTFKPRLETIDEEECWVDVHAANYAPQFVNNNHNWPLAKFARSMYQEYFDRYRHQNTGQRFSPLSLVESLNGIDGHNQIHSMNLNTSAGYPHKGVKRDFILEDEEGSRIPFEVIISRARDMHEQYEAGQMVYPVFKASLKDEPIKRKKNKEGRVRVFAASNFEWCLLFRMYYLPVLSYIQTNPLMFGIAVGINCASTEWQQLYNHLTFDGIVTDRAIAGDYKNFDKRQESSFVLEAFEFLMEIARVEGSYTDEDLQVMRMIAYDCVYSVTVAKGDVFQNIGSNPSGNPGTVHVNSIVNILYLMVCEWKLTGRRSHDPNRIRFAVYGDDNLIVSKDEAFNHTALVTVMDQELLQTYTMADKDAESQAFLDITEVSFLKRSFRWDDETQILMAPLEEKSICKSIHFIVKSESIPPKEQYTQILQDVNMQFFFHGRARHEARRQQLKELVRETEFSFMEFPDFDEIWERYAHSMYAISCA